MQPQADVPTLRIELDKRVILEKDMNEYFDRITEKYPPGQAPPKEATLEDMSLELESPEIKVLLVFNTVDINIDPQNDNISYWTDLRTMYISEKP